MDEIEKAVKTLNEIEKVFGLLGVIIVISIVLTGYLIFKWLDKSVEKMAEEASDKSLAKFQSTLDKRLETQVRLFFRNEDIRNSISSNYAIKSIDKKLEVWIETYKLYFEFQGTSHHTKEDLDAVIETFDKKIQANQENIFLNSVYLGGFMTSKLVILNTSLRQALRKQYLFNHLAYPQRDGQRVENEKKIFLNRIEAILPEVEKWITTNLTVDHNSKMWDFSEDQLKVIDEQNKQSFEEIKDIKVD